MKNLITILSIALLVACGGGEESVDSLIEAGDIDALKEMKAELTASKEELEAKLEQIEGILESGEDTPKKLPLVSLYEVDSQEFNHYVELQGNVETDQNILVFPEFSGKLLDLKVSMGDRVSKGQIVAIIDDGGVQKQLTQVEEKAKFSKITYEKRKRLWDQKIGSEIEFLAAETQHLADQEMVKQMKEQVAKTIVKAPFSGIVDEITADKGQLVIPGQTPLFRIINLSEMYIKADVPEKYLGSIKKGKAVKVNLGVLDTTVLTTVQNVSNYINPENRTYRVEIDVPNENGNIKPNLTAKLMINDYSSENAILIPQSIISENSSGNQYVYKAIIKNGTKEGVAQKVFIKTGVKQGDNIEVLSGLNVGELVIQEGARTVKNAQEVKIIK